MFQRTFSITMNGPDVEALVLAADGVGWVYTMNPPTMSLDYDDTAISGISVHDAVSRAQHRVQFGKYPDLVYIQKNDAPNRRLVQLRKRDFPIDEQSLLEGLTRLPFEIASIGRVYDEWGNVAIDDDAYAAPGWGDGHVAMGWAAAFKGEGHKRLVSRRWLETGPWRLLRGPNDTSLIIFHDLDADAQLALEQAKPGHAQIGITDQTGFLQIPFDYRYDLKGLYDTGEGVLKVVVHGREIPPRELLEWAAIRANHRLGPDKPIAAVRFIFSEESQARKHMPTLWRYGHECWAIIDGNEVRIDTDEIPAELTRAKP
jgi:hypothetical protein